jgi:hypothetical protein
MSIIYNLLVSSYKSRGKTFFGQNFSLLLLKGFLEEIEYIHISPHASYSHCFSSYFYVIFFFAST